MTEFGQLPPTSEVIQRGEEIVPRRFNHDLLVADVDRAEAQRRWPNLAAVLIHEELVSAFSDADKCAGRYRNWVRAVGTGSVIVVMIALFGALAESVSVGVWTRWPATVIELSSVAGIVGALAASRYGPWRRRWLMHRFVAESIRQWHFLQLLDSRVLDMLGGDDNESSRYTRRRQKDFQSYLYELRASAGQQMDRLREPSDASYDPTSGLTRPANSAVLTEALDAYGVLRLNHQFDFALYKVSPDDRTMCYMPTRQARAVSDFLAWMTLVLATVGSMITLFYPMPFLPPAIIGCLIAGVGVRAWRDGLAVADDDERYQEMRNKLGGLRARWSHARSDGARWEIAVAVEEVVLDELRAFLRAHERAQFIF